MHSAKVSCSRAHSQQMAALPAQHLFYTRQEKISPIIESNVHWGLKCCFYLCRKFHSTLRFSCACFPLSFIYFLHSFQNQKEPMLHEFDVKILGVIRATLFRGFPGEQ